MLLLKKCGFNQISMLINLLIIIAILVMAIIWQTKISHLAHNKFNYKIAGILANDMANRMQINYQASIKGNSSFYLNGNHVKQHLALACEKQPANCPAFTVAANDITDWQQAIRENLPNGVGVINTIPNNITAYAISISWQDPVNKTQQLFTTNILLPHLSKS